MNYGSDGLDLETQFILRHYTVYIVNSTKQLELLMCISRNVLELYDVIFADIPEVLYWLISATTEINMELNVLNFTV